MTNLSPKMQELINEVANGDKVIVEHDGNFQTYVVREDGQTWMGRSANPTIKGLISRGVLVKGEGNRWILATTAETTTEAEVVAMVTPLVEGDKVTRTAEPTGPIGWVRELRNGGRWALVSFSGLSPLWMRTNTLEKFSAPETETMEPANTTPVETTTETVALAAHKPVKRLTGGQATVLAYFADHTNPRKHQAVRAMKGPAYAASRRAMMVHGLLKSTDAFPYCEVTESGRAALAARKAA